MKENKSVYHVVNKFIYLLFVFTVLCFSSQTLWAKDSSHELVTEEVLLHSKQLNTEEKQMFLQYGILMNRFIESYLERHQVPGSSEYIAEKGVLRITTTPDQQQSVKDFVDKLGSSWGWGFRKTDTSNRVIFLDNHDVNISAMLWGAYSNKAIGDCKPVPEIDAVYIYGPDDYIEKSIEFFRRYDEGIHDLSIKSYPIWWGNGRKTTELIEAALDERGYTPPEWSNRLQLQITKTDEVLRVVDQQYIHDIIERQFSDPKFIEQAAPGNTTLQEFLILSPHAVGKEGTIVSLPYFQHAVMGIEALLYGDSGERRAHLDGRAMNTNYIQASVQVLDTPDNLTRVDKFLAEFLRIPPKETVSVHTLNFLTATEGTTYLKEANISETLTVLASLGNSHLMILGTRQEVRYAGQYLDQLDTPAGLLSGENEAQVIRYYYPQNRTAQYLTGAFSNQKSLASVRQTDQYDLPRIQLNGPRSIVEENLKKLESLDLPPKSYLANVYLLDLLGAEGRELENVAMLLRNTSPIKNTELNALQEQQLLRVVCSTNGFTMEDRIVSFGKKQPHLERLNIPQHNGWFVEITPSVQPGNNSLMVRPLTLTIYKDKRVLASVDETLLLSENNRGELLIPAWRGDDDITYGPWYLIVRLIEIK